MSWVSLCFRDIHFHSSSVTLSRTTLETLGSLVRLRQAYDLNRDKAPSYIASSFMNETAPCRAVIFICIPSHVRSTLCNANPLPFDHISNLQCQILLRPSTQPHSPFPPHLLSLFFSAARTTLPGTPPSNPSSPITHSPTPSSLAPGPNL